MRRYLQRGLVPAIVAVAVFAAAPAMAGSVEALMARSAKAEAAGKLHAAAVLMQAAVVANPKRAQTYVSLADLYARHNDPYFARKYYAEALDIDPTLARALLGAGRIDLQLGDTPAAKDKLARLEKSCGKDCAETASLRKAIEAPKNGKPDGTSASLDKG